MIGTDAALFPGVKPGFLLTPRAQKSFAALEPPVSFGDIVSRSEPRPFHGISAENLRHFSTNDGFPVELPCRQAAEHVANEGRRAVRNLDPKAAEHRFYQASLGRKNATENYREAVAQQTESAAFQPSLALEAYIHHRTSWTHAMTADVCGKFLRNHDPAAFVDIQRRGEDSAFLTRYRERSARARGT